MLRWALLLLAGCDGVFGIQHITTPDAAPDAPPDALLGYAAAVIADHPLAYLPLDETAGPIAHDRMGRYDGAYKGTGITYGVDPPFPSAVHAISIDGINGAVDLGDNFGFAGTLPYSIEAWFSPKTTTRTFYTVISKWREPSSIEPAGWNVFYDHAGKLAYTREAVGDQQVRIDTDYTAGWHYVVVTYNGSTMELYYDGQDADSTTSTFGLDVITEHLEIGGGNGDPAAVPLYGSIAQVAIYDYALSATQVSAHYGARSI